MYFNCQLYTWGSNPLPFGPALVNGMKFTCQFWEIPDLTASDTSASIPWFLCGGGVAPAAITRAICGLCGSYNWGECHYCMEHHLWLNTPTRKRRRVDVHLRAEVHQKQQQLLEMHVHLLTERDSSRARSARPSAWEYKVCFRWHLASGHRFFCARFCFNVCLLSSVFREVRVRIYIKPSWSN